MLLCRADVCTSHEMRSMFKSFTFERYMSVVHCIVSPTIMIVTELFP